VFFSPIYTAQVQYWKKRKARFYQLGFEMKENQVELMVFARDYYSDESLHLSFIEK